MHGLRRRALETGRSRSVICGSQAGVLRNATTMAWSGPSRPIGRYRASARPYTATRKCSGQLGLATAASATARSASNINLCNIATGVDGFAATFRRTDL